MKKANMIAIAATAIVAVGAAGAVAFSGSVQADQRGWHGSGHHKSMARHGGSRGMHRGHRMHGHGMHRMGREMMLEHLFDMADLDGDGTLDLDEYEGLFLELVRPVMVRSFQFFDRDGTGEIEAEDIQRPLDRMFDRLDRAGEGEISRESMRRGDRRDRAREWRRERGEMRRQMREERREQRGPGQDPSEQDD